MGVIQATEKKEDAGPECPPLLLGALDKFRELKFIRRDDGESVTLYAREMLAWSDLKAYQDMSGQSISYFETELIMGLDAIFEGKDDG